MLIGNCALFILLITIQLIKIYLKQFRNFVAVLHFIRIIVNSMTIFAINFKSITQTTVPEKLVKNIYSKIVRNVKRTPSESM